MKKDKLVQSLVEEAIKKAFSEAYGQAGGKTFPSTEAQHTLLNKISEYVYEKYARHVTVEKIKKSHGIE